MSLLIDFLANRKQRVVLNGQNLLWAGVKVSVSQGSILGSLFFLLCINDLTENLDSNPKLFVDDTSLFSIVHNVAQSNPQLSFDLTEIYNWAYKWKMSFNPDYTKPTHEVVFSRKRSETHHPLMFLLNVFHFICILD